MYGSLVAKRPLSPASQSLNSAQVIDWIETQEDAPNLRGGDGGEDTRQNFNKKAGVGMLNKKLKVRTEVGHQHGNQCS